MIAMRLIRSLVTNDYCSSSSKSFVLIDICEKIDKIDQSIRRKSFLNLCRHVHVLQNDRANCVQQ